ncbi:23S rRNA (guanosine(2251)-2'-O)-methyltransferase RlmB [Alginatibacterium sediminis]|uniref:23S rRNA (guanosine-2'-O-)-methyltransferase RlmB n=1 Tax=Alginatibacterium sediminis TaxID=2164068 RepID=A0A420E8T9_9ALTE|nr:23S rRNA (guanosine(2251)-2'-O)-methyltransferase RlmB [Alginatibacterium sediminis]RKF15801.1 23S rRNA (guanosine(2251)-2'-O)-methyltransferase RlmB [Alginatibacterium sediminis]
MSHEIIFGIHALTAFMERYPERVIEAFALKGRQDDRLLPLLNQMQKMGVAVQFAPRKTLDDKADSSQHQGIVARVKPVPPLNEAGLTKLIETTTNPLFLVLDGVTDPHNLGACLRNADAAGVTAVIVPKDKSASLNPTVRKVACGAAENMPLVAVTNLARSLREMQKLGVWIVGTAGEAEQMIYDCKMQGPLAIVMGAEDKGMRRLTRETCDELIKLPMMGSVSSLNVSVAAGVCLFEAVRQRQA